MVRDVDVAGGVESDGKRIGELPVAAAGRAPLGEVAARARELLDAGVVPVHDVDVAGRVDGDAERAAELSIAASRRAPRGDEVAEVIELLHAVVGVIDHVDVAGSVRRHAGGTKELARGGARVAPGQDERGRRGTGRGPSRARVEASDEQCADDAEQQGGCAHMEYSFRRGRFAHAWRRGLET